MWVALFIAAFALTISIDRARGGLASAIFAAEFGTAWAVGAVGLWLVGVPSYIAWRLAAGTISAWSVLLVAKGYGPEAVSVAIISACCYCLSFHPALRRRVANEVSFQDELRLPLRVPFLLWAFILTPAVFAFAFAAGLPALSAAGGIRVGPITVAVASLGFLLAIPLVISSYRLEQRWVIIAPRSLVVHDPLMLTSTLRISPEAVAHAELAGTMWRSKVGDKCTLLDLSGGALTNPLLVHMRERIEAPQPRRVGMGMAFPPAGYVTLVAVCLADPSKAYRSLAKAGYARRGEFARLETSDASKSPVQKVEEN